MNLNPSIQDRTKDFYNQAAQAYLSRNFHRIRTEILHKFLDLLPAKDKVLDVGCSTGRDVMWLKANGVEEVCGVDFAEEMIRLAKEYARADFRLIDATQGLPFDEAAFSGVICLGTLGNVSKDKAAKVIKEIYRVLRPKGVAVFTVKEGDREYLEVTNKYGPEYMNLPRRMSLFLESELTGLMTKSGFKVIESGTFSDDNYTWVVGYGRK